MIDAEKATYPIAWMCRLLAVPRSSFYAWRAQAATETATAERRRLLGDQVARVFTAGRGTYGCRRVTAALNRDGPCSVGLVATLKNEMYHRQVFPTRARARFAVAEYIEIFYNRQRLHSALGYRTPADVLTDLQRRLAA